MFNDAMIIVAVILVLIIIITMFGGCISCGNNGYSHEGMSNSTNSTTPLMDSRMSLTTPTPVAAPSIPAPPAIAPATVDGGALQGYDNASGEYASFRPLTS